MKYSLFLIFAIGLAAGEEPCTRLNLYGLPLWNVVDSVLKPFTLFTGLPGYHLMHNIVKPSIHLRNPFSAPFIPPTTPYGIWNQIPDLRSGIPNLNTRPINEVYEGPVIVMMRTEPGSFNLDAFYLEHGLSSLTENPTTRHIFEMIRTGAEKAAVVVHPYEMFNTPLYRILKDLKLRKLEVRPGLKVTNLMLGMNARVPIVFIHEKEDLPVLDIENLVRLGTFDVAAQKLKCSTCF